MYTCGGEGRKTSIFFAHFDFLTHQGFLRMKTTSYQPFHTIFPFEFFLVWNLHVRYIMMKQKFFAQPKNEDVFLNSLSFKFRKAGYKLTTHWDSKKKAGKSGSPFSITPINSDDVWCFNVCKPDPG